MLKTGTHVALDCLVALVVLASAAWAADPAAPAKKKEPIRKLTVGVDPIVASEWSAKPGVRVLSNQKEIVKWLGKAIAKQVEGRIDFAKENLVHVAWGSSGPPFGKLQYQIKDEKKERVITFYVQEPKATVRGEAFRLGNDFFAVPKKVQVRFKGSD